MTAPLIVTAPLIDGGLAPRGRRVLTSGRGPRCGTGRPLVRDLRGEPVAAARRSHRTAALPVLDLALAGSAVARAALRWALQRGWL